MADGDTRGAKDCVEGYDPREKKPLEKVTAPNRLLDLKREHGQLEVKVKKELDQERKKLMDLQTKLNDCNKDYADKKRELDKLRAEQNVKLTASQKQQITRLTQKIMNSFLQKRPRSEPGKEEQTIDVDVHYLPSMESSGLSLRIGGEGGGSRDAKFPVKLSENVKNLAQRAATYWGLDADKVFFLDRDGRIIFEDMSLREIVLPPVQQSSSSSSLAIPSGMAIADGRSAAQSSGASSSQLERYTGDGTAEGALELADEPPEHWTVKGRNYHLTLVRAMRPGEMPSREQVNVPKGEQWQDFTFDKQRLAQDLKDTLAKYGDPEFEDTNIAMDEIPSLYDLIESGKKKKQLKRADTAWRAAEFMIFCVCFILFHFLLRPSGGSWYTIMGHISGGIEQHLTQFNNEERSQLGVSSFLEVASNRQYEAWIHGPLKRSVVEPGLSAKNLFVVGTIGLTYHAPPHTVEPYSGWCPNPAASSGGAVGSDVDESDNHTADATTTTASSNAILHNPDACAPPDLQSCTNTRVVEVYAQAMRDGDLVPPCKTLVDDNLLLLILKSFKGDHEFSFVNGEVSSYFAGTRTYFNIRESAYFDASVAQMKAQGGEHESFLAELYLIFVYSPSMNGIFIYKMLVENTMAGSLVTSWKFDVVDLHGGQPSSFAIYALVIVLALIVFAMELRRIMGCPRRCAFEQKRDHCSCWTFLFLLLPTVTFVSFSIFSARNAKDMSEVMQIDQQTKSLTMQSVTEVHALVMLDYYTTRMNLIVLILLNILLFRFLLMYFVHLSFLTAMVSKIVKPLWYTLLYLIAALMVLGTFFYVMYSSRVDRFHNYILTILEAISFAQGGLHQWFHLYEDYTTLWTFVMLLGFVVIQLMLNTMGAAVMLSYKKEKDLRENYSYHRFWAAEISKMGKSKEEFNPANIEKKEKDTERDHAR